LFYKRTRKEKLKNEILIIKPINHTNKQSYKYNEKRLKTCYKTSQYIILARNLASEPFKNPNWKLHKTHSQICQSSATNATWAQTTQYGPAYIISYN
jgi:hypothetical protein